MSRPGAQEPVKGVDGSQRRQHADPGLVSGSSGGQERDRQTVISVSPSADWGESQGLVRLTKKETSNRERERETERGAVY